MPLRRSLLLPEYYFFNTADTVQLNLCGRLKRKGGGSDLVEELNLNHFSFNTFNQLPPIKITFHEELFIQR